MMMMIMTGLIFVFYLSTTGYELSRLFLSLSLADFIFLSSQLVSLYTHARYALDEKEPGGSRYARIRVCVCVLASSPPTTPIIIDPPPVFSLVFWLFSPFSLNERVK